MSFGLEDRDWVDPDPEPPYPRTCGECEHFLPLLELDCSDYAERMVIKCGDKVGLCMQDGKVQFLTDNDDDGCECGRVKE
jgi:hypothetical protein